MAKRFGRQIDENRRGRDRRREPTSGTWTRHQEANGGSQPRRDSQRLEALRLQSGPAPHANPELGLLGHGRAEESCACRRSPESKTPPETDGRARSRGSRRQGGVAREATPPQDIN
jgi:hypothetical protein